MNTLIIRLIVILISFFPLLANAQTVKESKEQASKGAVSARVQRQAAKQKWKEQRRIEHAQKAEIRNHDKQLQTKKTLKRMSETRKKSEKLRTNKRESFFVRLFKYKH